MKDYYQEVRKYQDILIFLLEQQVIIEQKLREAKIEYEKQKLSISK